MCIHFGKTHRGEQANLYTIKNERLTARITDFGATLVQLWVPDRNGALADVVLGYEEAMGYYINDCYFGAIVGRNCNRIKDGRFMIGDRVVQLDTHDNGNSLHSMPNGFNHRLWKVDAHKEDSITFYLHSPDGDQGFPGNADVYVTYTLEDMTLKVTFKGLSDADTVFNMTNHSYFNLAGHRNTDKAMEQTLCMSARTYTVADRQSIPTGEMRSVEGTPMDFRTPKPIGRDINQDYEALNFQGGYDHNFEVCSNPCAILTDPTSGRTMSVVTDCPGVQFYAGNYLNNEPGKGGVVYTRRSGICLETQYYPDAVNQPQFAQPFFKAGQPYHSETKFIFG